jgi:hypothetical protein
MLRAPARRTNPGRQRTSLTRSQPAPVRGWNTRDGIADMEPGYAVVLDNFFPMTAEIKIRKGSEEHVTDIDDGVDAVNVETLAAYKPQSGDEELFAWADDSLYDVSTPGPVGSALVSSLTNARWQFTNFTTSGGEFLIAVNGADELLLYDGSSFASIDGASTPSITNVLTTALIHVFVFKERVWYIEKDTLTLWYAAVGAFAGALTAFQIRSVAKQGGYLVAGGSWTRDTGTGPDDFLVLVTSQGEVIVYSGINPASDFALVGVFQTAKPIGRRCLLKYAGDLLIITTDGVIPISRLVVRERKEQGVAITEIIQGSMADAVALYKENFGWELFLYSEASMLLLNVPADTEQQQFVMNSYTKAWCRFLAWPANCFAEMDGELYFGTLGEVRKAWTGAADLDEMITAETVFNFTYFGDRGNLKETTLLRPIMKYDSPPSSIRIGIDADFELRTPTSEIVGVSQSGSIWDTAIWDSGFWGGDPTVRSFWQSFSVLGYALAFHCVIDTVRSEWVSISSVDIAYKRGSTL